MKRPAHNATSCWLFCKLFSVFQLLWDCWVFESITMWYFFFFSCGRWEVYVFNWLAGINRNDNTLLINSVCAGACLLFTTPQGLCLCWCVSFWCLWLCPEGPLCVCVCLTIVCEYALRSDHLIADMADNKRKILQCWKLAVDKHLWNRNEERRGHSLEKKHIQLRKHNSRGDVQRQNDHDERWIQQSFYNKGNAFLSAVQRGTMVADSQTLNTHITYGKKISIHERCSYSSPTAIDEQSLDHHFSVILRDTVEAGTGCSSLIMHL